MKCLTYESGVQLEYAVYRYWQENVYQDIGRAWSRNNAAKGSSHNEYEQFHAALQARFTPDMPERYELYRWHLDQEASMMAKPTVRNSLLRIMNSPNLNKQLKLKIVMAEPHITLTQLENFRAEDYACGFLSDLDLRRRVQNRRRDCLSHYLIFLDAARLSDGDFSDLTAIDIPHQLLSVNSFGGINVLDSTFQGLKKVDVKISQFPHSDCLERGGLNEVYIGGRSVAAKRLAKLLNKAIKMTMLSLEFPEGREAEYSFDIFNRTNIDRFPRLWLPHLKQLSLCRFRCTWEDLHVLLEVAVDVDMLTLRHCRLESGSMLDLILFLPNMKLNSISIEGKWSVDEDAGEWHSHNTAEFTDCVAATSYEGPFVVDGMRSRIEDYVLTGGDCPLPQWTPGGVAEQVWEMKGDTSWHYLPGPIRG